MAAKEFDFDLLLGDWKAGVKSPRQMSKDYELLTGEKISHQTIRNYFNDKGIARNLQQAIRDKVKANIDAALVGKDVDSGAFPSAEEIVEAAAKRGTDTILTHQTEIVRYRQLAQRLVAEIEITSDNRELFEEVGDMLRKENDKGVDKLNDAYQKVIALPGRVAAFKQLAEVLKILIGLERQAFGLSDNANGDPDTPPEKMTDLEAARRIAFALTRAST